MCPCHRWEIKPRNGTAWLLCPRLKTDVWRGLASCPGMAGTQEREGKWSDDGSCQGHAVPVPPGLPRAALLPQDVNSKRPKFSSIQRGVIYWLIATWEVALYTVCPLPRLYLSISLFFGCSVVSTHTPSWCMHILIKIQTRSNRGWVMTKVVLSGRNLHETYLWSPLRNNFFWPSCVQKSDNPRVPIHQTLFPTHPPRPPPPLILQTYVP